ncbi:MAG: type II toxin-antitoxin system RelE/ParE family toxin [Pelistega sp.]|nr:type II toxin-antitoxin system RelE/ParE family toxin [Pelistega sp.]
MIKSFKHKGLQKFFETGSTSGIQAKHAARLGAQLLLLNTAKSPKELNIPNWRLHPLGGRLKGHCSLVVNANWRLTFMFDGEDVFIVDYQDYH